MIGGPPMVSGVPFMPMPRPPVPAAMAQGTAFPRSAPPSPRPVAQTAPPRPIIRMQAADEPPPRRVALSLPPPEQLGVIVPSSGNGGADWAMVHQRLEKLGATCFLQEKLNNGGSRVTCLIPTCKPGQSRRVEAQAGTVAEAARLALDEAEKWAGGR